MFPLHVFAEEGLFALSVRVVVGFSFDVRNLWEVFNVAGHVDLLESPVLKGNDERALMKLGLLATLDDHFTVQRCNCLAQLQ